MGYDYNWVDMLRLTTLLRPISFQEVPFFPERSGELGSRINTTFYSLASRSTRYELTSCTICSGLNYGRRSSPRPCFGVIVSWTMCPIASNCSWSSITTFR